MMMMMRSRGATSTSMGNTRPTTDPKVGMTVVKSWHSKRPVISLTSLFSFLVAFVLGITVQNYFHGIMASPPSSQLPPQSPHIHAVQVPSVMSSGIPVAFDGMIRRAQIHQQHCQALGLNKVKNFQGFNDHDVHLTQYGFLDYLQQYQQQHGDQYHKDASSYPYTCQLPPEHECTETQFTVVFMAYNPDRLKKMYNQIVTMINTNEFHGLVKEVVVVWNGERHVEETPLGQQLVDLTQTQPVRISYPLQAGFPNDLFNRYHPRLAITTKAIMYYDDDGPFYSYKATLGGFELWKRNSNAQIGAMARKIDYSPRQDEERSNLLNGPGDRFFVSHCPTDEVRYNFNEFAQFGAKMVLPSGSFLHVNYLACLWHPIFQELRDYVQKHPVNPDDGTVSAIVAQLSGRAPKVYSRRINESSSSSQQEQGAGSSRRLLQQQEEMEDIDTSSLPSNDSWSVPRGNDTFDSFQLTEFRHHHHRRLMDGINWDAGGDHQKKHDWGKLRSDAANSLMRYFGSINSGSIGWCYGTPYQQGEYCKPDQAKVGQLPWLKPDHTPKDTCP